MNCRCLMTAILNFTISGKMVPFTAWHTAEMDSAQKMHIETTNEELFLKNAYRSLSRAIFFKLGLHLETFINATIKCAEKNSRYVNYSHGARFTNVFLPVIQIRWKLRLSIIPLLAIRSQQIFAHATTAQLSCHCAVVPFTKFCSNHLLESRWEWNVISVEFELRWKTR